MFPVAGGTDRSRYDALGHSLAVHALLVFALDVAVAGAAQVRNCFAERVGPGGLNFVRGAVTNRAIGRGRISFGALASVNAQCVRPVLALMASAALRLRDPFRMGEILMVGMAGGARHRRVDAGCQLLRLRVMTRAAGGGVARGRLAQRGKTEDKYGGNEKDCGVHA